MEHHLGHARDGEVAFRPVPLRQQPARLHGHGGEALHVKALAPGVGRVAERGSASPFTADSVTTWLLPVFEQQALVRARGARSATGGSGSMSSAIRSSASSASAALSATTTASGSPT